MFWSSCTCVRITNKLKMQLTDNDFVDIMYIDAADDADDGEMPMAMLTTMKMTIIDYNDGSPTCPHN